MQRESDWLNMVMYSGFCITFYSSGKSVRFNRTADTSNTVSGQKQCAAITKAGKRCKKLAMAGSEYC